MRPRWNHLQSNPLYFWSGWGESNPRLSVGNALLYP
jgi:hypothetical protein